MPHEPCNVTAEFTASLKRFGPGLLYHADVEAFEELYCRISALELLVFAMAEQMDGEQFARDLEIHKERLLTTATFASLSPEVAERLTATIDRYARVVQGL